MYTRALSCFFAKQRKKQNKNKKNFLCRLSLPLSTYQYLSDGCDTLKTLLYKYLKLLSSIFVGSIHYFHCLFLFSILRLKSHKFDCKLMCFYVFLTFVTNTYVIFVMQKKKIYTYLDKAT